MKEGTQVEFTFDPSLTFPQRNVYVGIPFGKIFPEKKPVEDFLKLYKDKIVAVQWKRGHILIMLKDGGFANDLIGKSFETQGKTLKITPYPFEEKVITARFALNKVDPRFPLEFYGQILSTFAPILNLRWSINPNGWKEDSLTFQTLIPESAKLPHRLRISLEDESTLHPIVRIGLKSKHLIPKKEIDTLTFRSSKNEFNPKVISRSSFSLESLDSEELPEEQPSTHNPPRPKKPSPRGWSKPPTTPHPVSPPTPGTTPETTPVTLALPNNSSEAPQMEEVDVVTPSSSEKGSEIPEATVTTTPTIEFDKIPIPNSINKLQTYKFTPTPNFIPIIPVPIEKIPNTQPSTPNKTPEIGEIRGRDSPEDLNSNTSGKPAYKKPALDDRAQNGRKIFEAHLQKSLGSSPPEDKPLNI